MSVISIFAQALYRFFKLINGMHDIGAFQLYITLFTFICREKEFVTSYTFLDCTPVNINTLIGKPPRVQKNNLSLILLKHYLWISGLPNTRFYLVSHTFKRKL